MESIALLVHSISPAANEAQAKLFDMTPAQYAAEALCSFVNGT
jgi:hypothetical protein